MFQVTMINTLELHKKKIKINNNNNDVINIIYFFRYY